MIFPKRKAPDAAAAWMLPLNDFAWPVTYSYIVANPWGTTRQVLTVDAPACANNEVATERLGRLLWAMVTAPAVSFRTQLFAMTVTPWRQISVPVLRVIQGMRGTLLGDPLPRERTPQVVMLAHPGDNDSRRRLFMAGAPERFATGDLLDTDGFEALVAHCQGLMLGLASPGLGSGIEWLLAYPGMLEHSLDNFTGVAFRRVQHLRVVHHLDKAPLVTDLMANA